MTEKGTANTHYKTAAKRKTGRIQVLLTPEELEKIKTRAERKGVSVSQYARDAIMKSITPRRSRKK